MDSAKRRHLTTSYNAVEIDAVKYFVPIPTPSPQFYPHRHPVPTAVVLVSTPFPPPLSPSPPRPRHHCLFFRPVPTHIQINNIYFRGVVKDAHCGQSGTVIRWVSETAFTLHASDGRRNVRQNYNYVLKSLRHCFRVTQDLQQ